MRTAFCVLALNVLCFAQTSAPTTKPPKLLLHILHCAETDKFGLLHASLKKDDVIKVSWHHSLSSDASVGEEFFIVLRDSDKSSDVLVYVRRYENGKTNFYAVNNAGLSMEHGDVRIIDALGGIWVYNHIKQNVKIALHGGQYSIPARSLVGPQFANVGCDSYSDPE